VRRFHAAGRADEGGPGLRGGPAGDYAAFLHDPEGHQVEAVHHAGP
jgi:hypothetical protein